MPPPSRLPGRPLSARTKLRDTRDIAAYIKSQMADMYHAYRKNRLSFLVVAFLMGLANAVVVVLVAEALSETISQKRYDITGIMVIVTSVVAFLNLALSAVNVLINHRYRYRRYLDACRTLQAMHISYLYGIDGYDGEDAIVKLRQDVEIVLYSTRPTKRKSIYQIVTSFYREGSDD